MVFSDINASSWRQGATLVRRVLGPAKRISQPHSPPTHDTVQHDWSAESQSRTSADIPSTLAVGPVVPPLTQGDDVLLPGELERTAQSCSQDAAAASAVEQLSNSLDDVLVSETGVDDAASQYQQLPAATNASYLNVQEPSFHRITISLPGTLLQFSVICWRNAVYEPVVYLL